jgi:hypothetical protein
MTQAEPAMPTLSTILHEKRDDILKLASQFNFKTDSVQLLCHPRPGDLLTSTEPGEFPNTLYFVMEGIEHKDMYDEENEEHFADCYSLEVHLSETLGCDIGIIFLKDLQGIYWKRLLDYCANISEDDKIIKLFNAPSLDQIEVEELDRNDKHFRRRQEIATRKPEVAQEKKHPLENTTNGPHSMFKRKRLDSDEPGYSPSSSPASTTDGESDHEELFVNETMAQLTKQNNLSVSAIDKFIEKFQKLKQKKLSSSGEESDLNPKKQHTNKI